MDRSQALTHLVDYICTYPLPRGGVLRIAIDGPDAAGKTTLAQELAALLEERGKIVIQSSLDRFHFPREHRYRQGDLSPTGYYEDSFDLGALNRLLLEPLGPGGNRVIRDTLFNPFQDTFALSEPRTVPGGAVLLFDGVFLLRPELKDAWDFSIFVQVSLETVLSRASVRDVSLFGSKEIVRERYLSRYLPAQQFYLSRIRPDLNANVVFKNDDPEHPQILFNSK